ncbi:heterokaryon incompatibility protein-domain-containing protein [Xylariaceae sp. FL1019]|nr:heterokaryon incompatibility protein-domain-containing protein [Xylariaceae sp. FL1019]
MRLLRVQDGKISLTKDYISSPGPYAILSHTWSENNDDEVSLADMVGGRPEQKKGFAKIEFCAKQALSDGLEYFWVDTCCIDKTNSTELSEAINSMFRWYRDAARCYVYLTDATSPADSSRHAIMQLRHCRWFTRGWTLQELIASPSVDFFALDGERLGDKVSLEVELSEITGITAVALRGKPLSDFSVEARMSWTKGRTTTREEDMAYSIMGLFEVHMPLIYGEGRKNAYRRLNEEIAKSSRSLGRDEHFSNDFSYGNIPELLSRYFHLSDYLPGLLDERQFHKSAQAVFEQLCSSRSPLLTTDQFRDFYLFTLTRFEIDASHEPAVYDTIRDLVEGDGDHIAIAEFIPRLKRLLDCMTIAHEQDVRKRLKEYRSNAVTESPPNFQPSWGWDKMAVNGATVFRDVVSGRSSGARHPIAHRDSFSNMAMDARHCLDTLKKLSHRFLTFIPRAERDRYTSTFESLRDTASKFILPDVPDCEDDVNPLDSVITSCFVCRTFADARDVPVYLSTMEALVTRLQPLWLSAARTLQSLRAVLACLLEINDNLESKHLLERQVLLNTLWHKKDISCLARLVSNGAPDWDEMHRLAKQLVTSRYVLSLMKAAEDIAYNYVLRTPTVLLWNTLVVDRSKIRKRQTTFLNRLKDTRPNLLELAVTDDYSEQHNLDFSFQCKDAFQAMLNQAPTFTIGREIHLQPTTNIMMTLLQNDNILNQETMIGKDDFWKLPACRYCGEH